MLASKKFAEWKTRKLITDNRGDRTRQLAVVMFADMTGYTALMQADEKNAKILMDRQRKSWKNISPVIMAGSFIIMVMEP